jgi:2EXR family
MSGISASFSSLPKELRLQIWEHTFTRRVIALQIQRYLSRDNFPSPTRRDPLPDLVIADDSALDRDVWMGFFASSIEPVPAFHVCKESREVALRQGYITWNLRNKDWRRREVLWNPALDVVAFVGPHHPVRVGSYISVFLNQFFHEAEIIRTLSLPAGCCTWILVTQGHEMFMPLIDRRNRLDAAPLMKGCMGFEHLEELIVIHNSAFLNQFPEPLSYSTRLLASIDTARSLSESGERPSGNWQVPVLRLVEDEHSILSTPK